MGSKILDEARSWEGTPYSWRTKIKGIGVDCGTFLHAVYERFYEIPPMPHGYREANVTQDGGVGNYWMDYLTPLVDWLEAPEPGDAILLKYGANFCHGGVMEDARHVWHSYGRRGFAGVTRSPISFFKDRGVMREHRYWRFRDELLRSEWR